MYVTVRLNGSLGRRLRVDRGVRQGSITSHTYMYVSHCVPELVQYIGACNELCSHFYWTLYHHYCPSTSRISVKSCPPLAQPMAMPLAVVRSWIEQAVFIMGQTSRCCMVFLMPQSPVYVSLEYPDLSMFTLDSPNLCTQPVECLLGCPGFSVPAGRCSSALMRCTLASRGSSRSLHNSMRPAFAAVLMGSVHLIKLFRDFRRGTTPR